MVKYGPADSSHAVVTISERLRLSSGHPDAYGFVAWPLMPQIKDGVVLESLYRTEGFAWMADLKQVYLILMSFVNHLAFRGAHLRTCDA